MTTPADEIEKIRRELAIYQQEQRDLAWARQFLRDYPCPDLGGHVLGPGRSPSKQPLKGVARTVYRDRIVEFAKHLINRQPGEKISVGFIECYRGIVQPCVNCGLFAWTIDDAGLHPRAHCPFLGGERVTSVMIDVPSGKLMCGVTMHGYLYPGGWDKVRELKLYDGTWFLEHHVAKLWECLGIAEMDLLVQDENQLCQVKSDRLILSSKRPAEAERRVAEIFTYMPKFACADETFIRPFHARDEPFLRPEARFTTVRVPPGRYQVTQTHGPRLPKVLVGQKWLPARLTIQRMGEAEPIPALDILHGRLQEYLTQHPWLREEPRK